MSAELAYQKADKHLCVALHRKLRIRLHPSVESDCGIGKRNLCEMFPYHEKRQAFFLIYVHNPLYPRYFFVSLCTKRPMLGKNN